MNLAQVVKKIETLGSRINDPIHIGGWESQFEGQPLSVLCRVKEIYIFGSSIYTDDPNDIDLIVTIDFTKNHRQYINERNHARDYYWQEYFLERLVRQTLKKRMKKVHITTGNNVESTAMGTKLWLLVWSQEKPDVKQNFTTGRQNVDLSEECRHLRKQLKTSTNDVHVLKKIARHWLNNPDMSRKEKLWKLDDIYYKRDVPMIKRHLEKNTYSTPILKEFAEIKQQKDSYNLLYDIYYGPLKPRKISA